MTDCKLNKYIKHQVEKLEKNGECTIEQTGICTIINTARKGKSTGQPGRNPEDRQGHIVRLTGNKCLVKTDLDLIPLDTKRFFDCKVWDKTWNVNKNKHVVSQGCYLSRTICAGFYGKKYIKDREIVHLNGCKTDNRLFNLVPLTRDKSRKFIRMLKRKKVLEDKAELNAKEAKEYDDLKVSIKQEVKAKNDLDRQIEANRNINGFIVDREDILKIPAPIKSKVMAEQRKNEVTENVTDIVIRCSPNKIAIGIY